MKILSYFINRLHKLPKESHQKFLALAELKKFPNKTILSKFNEVPSEFYIIKSGIIRSYYQDNNGKEYIRSLFTTYTAIGAIGSLITNEPSKLAYQCLTDCEVYIINFKKLKQLVLVDNNISIMYSNALENTLLIFEKKIYNLTLNDATERYLALKKEIPDIENLIPQYHIAAYLNISAVQLSRIRKKLYSQ
ncbi:Crp/Fnr family transcriptional regulator [Polaribacter sargassicola]|uniref:Crp/Fnr family transcriptional regulator n=1 Tax=Polaribacter sargassicola TaxID=2836891 RepID=UPI001F20BEB5|nr:Crp/Fnr family transcriptional regulator [Polaribacter sp. DS7-9]MCG1035569.1 Crp/Fnr family transcriptional regulator [Polaribacter sp. DS7-9]